MVLFPETLVFLKLCVRAEGYGGAVERGERERFLADNSSDEEVNTTLILAAKRTQRKDPLNDFHEYRGGWNISNTHYWAVSSFSFSFSFYSIIYIFLGKEEL